MGEWEENSELSLVLVVWVYSERGFDRAEKGRLREVRFGLLSSFSISSPILLPFLFWPFPFFFLSHLPLSYSPFLSQSFPSLPCLSLDPITSHSLTFLSFSLPPSPLSFPPVYLPQLSWGGGSNLKVGAHWRARAYKGVWWRSPQRGAEPLVGGRSPPEAERFLGIIRRKDRQYLPLYPIF